MLLFTSIINTPAEILLVTLMWSELIIDVIQQHLLNFSTYPITIGPKVNAIQYEDKLNSWLALKGG